MDEIEFRELYNSAIDEVRKLLVSGDTDHHNALMMVLRMIWDLNERLLEFQVEEDC